MKSKVCLYQPVTITVTASDPVHAALELLQKTGGTNLPVDVFGIARQLGVGVSPQLFPDALSALVIRHDGGAIIGVNALHAPARQRFSIGHELGHFVLHHETDHFVDYGGAQSEGDPPDYNWQHERAANVFAAELLMPAERVKADVSSHSIGRLAKRYGVSEAAMGFRLANLRLQPK